MTEPAAKPDRTWAFVGLGFVIVLALYLIVFQVFYAPEGAPGDLPPARLSMSAEPIKVDFGFRVLDLNDKPVSFERFRGKVVFLNIWATWCPPCVEELPSIARLAANPRLRDKDVAFVCISTDESAGAVSDFLKGKDWPMTFLRATGLPPILVTEDLPATFVIDREARVVAMKTGAAAWDGPAVVELLETLAKPVAAAEIPPQ
jgi:thiol-disulfide isomerase/thioredoxin